MTGPDRKIIAALDRRGSLDRAALIRATRLSEPAMDVSLRKLERMGWITSGKGTYALSGRGRNVARTLRGGNSRPAP